MKRNHKPRVVLQWHEPYEGRLRIVRALSNGGSGSIRYVVERHSRDAAGGDCWTERCLVPTGVEWIKDETEGTRRLRMALVAAVERLARRQRRRRA